MKWSDLTMGGEWNIPKEAREKDTAGSIVLPDEARAIIVKQSRLASNPYVFAGRGDRPYRGFSQARTAFDRKLPDVAPWVIHDLRRTARSLMARAGVRPDIAERVMGHAIKGVEGFMIGIPTREEKADALQRLAVLIDGIVHPARTCPQCAQGNRRPMLPAMYDEAVEAQRIEHATHDHSR